MKAASDKFTQWISQATDIENQLATELHETAGEVAHCEDFDMEQRSEIYAILEAIKSDSEVHKKVVGKWVNDRTGEISDV